MGGSSFTRLTYREEASFEISPLWDVCRAGIGVTILLEFCGVCAKTEPRAMTDAERSDFAAILQSVTSTYDRVFDTPFPYSMGLHPAPCNGREHPDWQFHAHFYPPLL